MATNRRKKTDVDAALKAVSETDVRKVLEQVGATQTSVQGTLAALGVTLTELRDLEMAIGARKDELKDIHDIEVQADTLDEISEQVKTADEDAQERTRKRRKEWQDALVERDQAQTREREVHIYEVKQRDERDKAECDTQSTERQRQECFRMEDVSKRLSERVEAVDAREEQMEALEAKVEAFADERELAVQSAEEALTKRLSAGFGHEKALIKKDSESAEALAYANKASLNQQISALQSQLESTIDQLSTARDDARNIATSAVEAASQRQALDTLQKSMETQAAGGGSSGSGRGR